MVHSEYDVEVVEIGGGDFAASVGELQSATACMNAHAVVGEVAGVSAIETGGVDFPI